MRAITTRLLAATLGLVACFILPAWSQGENTVATEQCLGCHDFGPESPVHAVMQGSHGVEDTGGVHGCQDCHGPSADHAGAPTRVSPAISFGPRWTATSADQDSQCLACHEDNIAAHWRDALHMLNGLTCVTEPGS